MFYLSHFSSLPCSGFVWVRGVRAKVSDDSDNSGDNFTWNQDAMERHIQEYETGLDP